MRYTKRSSVEPWIENLVKKVIKGRMKGKRGRGKPRITMLDHIKADEPHGKIKCRAMDRESF